jgi:hypothetical protein
MKSVSFAPLTSEVDDWRSTNQHKNYSLEASEVRRDCSKMWNTKSGMSDGFGSATDS